MGVGSRLLRRSNEFCPVPSCTFAYKTSLAVVVGSVNMMNATIGIKLHYMANVHAFQNVKSILKTLKDRKGLKEVRFSWLFRKEAIVL